MKELTTELVKNTFTVGETYRYVDMCEMLGQERARGSKSKQLQLSKWECFMSIEQVDSHRFKVIEIYDTVLPRIDGRKNNSPANNYKEDERFMIAREDMNSIGVYGIILNNNIYIGSTTRGFRERFRGHREVGNTILHTKELLDRGAKFYALEYMDGENEETIRKREEYYIGYYQNHPEWNCINKFSETHTNAKKKSKAEERIKISIMRKDCHNVIELLSEHGYSVTIDKRYKIDEV